MIDLHFMRENPQLFRELVLRKEPEFNVELLITLDKQLREEQRTAEEIRHQRNNLAAQGATQSLAEQMRERARALNQTLSISEQRSEKLAHEFRELYLSCPNLPAHDVPIGNKEANTVVKIYGHKPEFSFAPKHHLALNEQVKWFDFASAARMTGSQFVWYNTTGASLLYTLSLLMLQHNQSRGYTLVLPPYLVNTLSLEGAAQFPKFRDAVYSINNEDLYLTPTSEVNLTAFYRDHIFPEEELPVRMTSLTSCFRREAGTYGASERGLIRIHQFEKAELYTICTAEQATIEHERMVSCAEELLQLLGLHYRISLLATQDSSFAAAKTYDLEVWMPGQQEYREVSSSSLCTDFQARRSSIKYKPSVSSKAQLAYTLNTSSLALPRIMVALMETYQQEDGSIKLPHSVDSVTWTRNTA
jgi:seryl-tRNA synthetase